ncbi:hypothetical protein R1T16_17550 [Flavobacterium sp. DG1-102-2]|uniref:hypothetical protein n=1 Tax=Flavobacterium sp. DG1-102-2 TaxID=3081663 RepID=UPI0029495060|nr:hypothetical protein [Flavobacterium sp. DG1-102-2]MDV6170246.1 hypothetical protein [Flavobacterium sp. DG1-102-2]
MKNRILCTLLLISAISFGQNPKVITTGSHATGTIYNGVLGANGAMLLPEGDTTAKYPDLQSRRRFQLNSITNRLQFNDGNGWVDVVDASRLGQANGVPLLDANAKISTVNLPDAILGAVNYQGNYDASTNSPALPSATTNKGKYWVVAVAGTQVGLTLNLGDWVISNGSLWQKLDQTGKVASVAGKTGAVTISKSDVGLALVDNTPDSVKPVSTPQQQVFDGKANKDGSNATGTAWPIGITGNATTATFANSAGSATTATSSGSTANFGGIGADFGFEGGTLNAFMGIDGNNIGRKYALSTVANTVRDNSTGTWANIVSGNSNGLGGYQYADALVNTANVGNFLIRRSNNTTWNIATPATIADALGVNAKANDANVIHTTGNETKTGSLTLTGNVIPNSVFASGVLQAGSAQINYDGIGGANLNGVNFPNGGGITWSGGSSGTALAASAENFIVYTSGSERLRMNPSGYFGINTNNPLWMLHVNGHALFGSGTVNAGTTKIGIKNDAPNGKVWTLSSGQAGVNEGYFTLNNVTEGVTPFFVVPSGTVAFNYPVIVPDADASNKAVNKGQMDAALSTAGRPYKVYTALITQSGTNAPVANVLENTIGGSPTWSYSSTGQYRLNLNNNGFVAQKTACFVNGLWSSLSTTNLAYRAAYADGNTVTLITNNGNSTQDGLLSAGSVFEVRVYN